MSAAPNVYVGSFGDYPIPELVQQRAVVMNSGKRLDDKRTKGARYLQHWGRTQDRGVEMARHLETMIEKDRG